jgi:hypothetical protein
MTALDIWKRKFDHYVSIRRGIDRTLNANPTCKCILTAALDMNGVPYNIVLHAVDGDAFQGELQKEAQKVREARAVLSDEEMEQATAYKLTKGGEQ